MAYTTAYRNTGTRNEWVRLHSSSDYAEAKRSFEHCSESRSLERSQVALFVHQGAQDWRDGTIRLSLDNRDRNTGKIRGLGGLICSLDSSWF